jgi:ribosome biogenesis GTPase
MNNITPHKKIHKLLPENTPENEAGRIILEHKERYVLQNGTRIYQAEITGNLRYSAQSRADFPAVGDWVRFTPMDEQHAIILEVFPRYSVLQRQSVGKALDNQLIATNIDVAFIVQSVGQDFNLNRLERYLTICNASDIQPVILLNKTDLIPEAEREALLKKIEERVKHVPLIAVSAITQEGIMDIEKLLLPDFTFCFLGSSGVGKSTLINFLANKEIITNEVSESTGKGKHTTSHRQLFVLANQSMVIDTPGMREIGVSEHDEGIERTFDYMEELTQNCRFTNCSHTSEKGCALIAAMEQGEIAEEKYNNYLKLIREQEHYSNTIAEKRQRDKERGKMYKRILNEKRKLK